MRKSYKIAAAVGAVTLAGAVGLSSFALADSEYGRGGYHGRHHGEGPMHWRGHHGGPDGHHGGPDGHRYARLMERFDADKNGKLTQGELDQSRKDLLAKHDANKDGKLSLDEFKALWLEVMQRRVVRGFQRIDTDGDAVITIEEFLTPYADVVERMDRNEDGVLDKEDRKFRHHGRGGPEDDGPNREKKG